MSEVLLTEWARLLISSLVQSGVTNVVVSPGSRSTPFAWAALNQPGLSAFSALDERTAGFFALGQARVSGRPTLLIATSGSAPAHYFPAILEASYAHLPLLVLSADRPRQLQYRAAPQTIDQLGLFGHHVRAAFALSDPAPSAAALRALQATAAIAVRQSLAPEPGPVHLNAPAAKPLAPVAPELDDPSGVRALVTSLVARGSTSFSLGPLVPEAGALARLAEDVERAQRGLIVCGALGPRESDAPRLVLELARKTGFPVLAESASQLCLGTTGPEVFTAFDSFLRTTTFQQLRPELVLEFGQPLTSQAWAEYQSSHSELGRHVVAPYGWPDVSASAGVLHRCAIGTFAEALCAALPPLVEQPRERRSQRQAWFSELARLAEHTRQATERVLESEAFGEASAVHQVCASLPDDSLFIVGNSLPLRAVDAFAVARSARITTLTQRGTNGIDGLVSGASGTSSQVERPTTLLLGDVSLAHDAGGLWLARRARHPLVIVVLDNAGGRIFDELPWGAAVSASARVRDFWLTPPELEHRALASAYGIAFAEPRSRQELILALAEAYARPGASLLSVKVAPDSYKKVMSALRRTTRELSDGVW